MQHHNNQKIMILPDEITLGIYKIYRLLSKYNCGDYEDTRLLKLIEDIRIDYLHSAFPQKLKKEVSKELSNNQKQIVEANVISSNLIKLMTNWNDYFNNNVGNLSKIIKESGEIINKFLSKGPFNNQVQQLLN